MNKNELKQALKPLIKEAVKEVLFEEGVLSGIVSEVAKGMAGANTIVETRQPQTRPDHTHLAEQEAARKAARKAKIDETRRQMQESVGKDAYGGVNLFEGTEALTSGGSPNEPAPTGGPLSGVTPGDSGVDISGIFSSNWSKLAAGNKR